MKTSSALIEINYFEVTGTVTGAQSSPVLLFSASAVDANSRFYCIQLERGTMATDWSPSPSDPSSGVKTSYIDIATDHIDISTGGLLSMSGAKVQIDASNANDSRINFGDVFRVEKDTDGILGLSISSPNENAIKINNKPVWHRGNILIQDTQPAGNDIVWLKPSAITTIKYSLPITNANAQTFSGSSSSTKTYSIPCLSTDVMTAAGTYRISAKFSIYHSGNISQTISGVSVTLKKGGKALALPSLGSFKFNGWGSRLGYDQFVDTTLTEFSTTTGDITCEIKVSGTIAYTTSNFLIQESGVPIDISIKGAGSSSAQPCTVYYIP